MVNTESKVSKMRQAANNRVRAIKSFSHSVVYREFKYLWTPYNTNKLVSKATLIHFISSLCEWGATHKTLNICDWNDVCLLQSYTENLIKSCDRALLKDNDLFQIKTFLAIFIDSVKEEFQTVGLFTIASLVGYYLNKIKLEK